jgi:hypothetical protein
MRRGNIATILLVSLVAFASSSTSAQKSAPAPAGDCDAVCQIGHALNKKDSPIQSRSGIRRGVVTNEPEEQRKDFRPPGDTDPNTRIGR